VSPIKKHANIKTVKQASD